MAADSSGAAVDSGGGDRRDNPVNSRPLSNLQRMMGLSGDGNHSRRMRNIIIFCSTIGATLIVLIASFLLAGENSYNRRAKVSMNGG